VLRDLRLKRLVARHLRSFALQPPGTTVEAGRHAAVALAIADAGHGADLPGMPIQGAWSREAALVLTRRSPLEVVPDDEAREYRRNWVLTAFATLFATGAVVYAATQI